MVDIILLAVYGGIAFWGYKRGLNIAKVLVLELVMTPIAGLIYVLAKGKIKFRVFLIVYVAVFLLAVLYMGFLRNGLCNLIMRDLDYASSSGTKVVMLDKETGEYSWEYIPGSLEAKTKGQVGYVLEVDYSSDRATYISMSGGGVSFVDVEIIYANLVDCDTGEVVAEKRFEADAPSSISSGISTVSVSESEVSTWIESVIP